ncbi:MAG: PepSY domain-containing protein [Gemmobacter sp.]
MKTRLILLATVLALSGGMAAAAISTQGLIDDLGAQGYTRVEVKVGPTQTKIEAIRGAEKLEVVYDNATGTTLKSEVEAVRPGEDTAPGVSIRNRGRDFVRNAGADEDDDSGRGRGRGRGGDDGDDGDGDDDSDDDGDDRDDDDDDGEDNDGGDDDGGDDDGDDD